LSTITAATNLGAAWCGLGTGEAIRRRVGREPSLYPELLGHCLIVTMIAGTVLTAVMSAIIAFSVTVARDPVDNFVTITLLVLSNIVMFTGMTLTEQILLTHSQFARANLLNFGFSIARALAIVVACLGFGIDSVSAWAWWNFATFMAGSVACVCLLFPYGAPRWRLLREELSLGVTMSISSSITALRQNVDVLALTATAPPQFVGAYGVARRVLAIAMVTGASLDRLVYAKFAIAGKSGPAATLVLARQYVVYAIGLTGLCHTGACPPICCVCYRPDRLDQPGNICAGSASSAAFRQRLC
jgi:O-antigen/teichoic acid export membrane protein